MLIVETGSGASTSESYVSVADADTYFSNRGITTWAPLATADKEAALRRAADFMVQTYRLRWSGYRFNNTQALDWPRYAVPRADSGGYRRIGYYSSDSVPKEVQNAQVELALKAAAGELLPDVDPPVQSESVGPIAVTYFQGATQIKRFVAVDRLLAPFMQSGSNIKLIRA